MANNEVRIIITGDNQAEPALRRALDQMERVERQERRTNNSLRDSFRQGVRGGPDLLETAAQNAGAAVGAIVNPATLAAGAALLLGQQLGVSTREAREFEKVFTNVASLSAHTADELEDVRKGVLRLGPAVGQGPDSLAEALYDVVSAGYAGDDAMIVLEASAKGAAAGLTDTKVAADAVTTALNAYGMEAGDAERVTDLIQMAVKEGKTTWAEMGSSLGNVIPLAASAGVELSTLNAVIATTTSQGIKTSESVTGLKAVISSIVKPSSEAVKLAGELNVAYDAQALKAKGLAGFLQDVAEATGGNQERLATLFGSVEALNTVLALTSESGGKKFLEVQEAMQNASGATERAFETQAATAEATAARRDAAIESIRISVGTIFLPAITKMTEGVASVLTGIVEWQNALPPLERNMKSFKEQNEGAADAVGLLQDAIEDGSGNGLLGAIDSLAETLGNEGKQALEGFALNTVKSLIAQGKLQEAIDLTIAKFIALQTEENKAQIASTQALLGRETRIRDAIQAEIDYLEERNAGQLTASPLIQESIDEKLVDLEEANGEIAKHQAALEQLQGPLNKLIEMQEQYASGALSAEQVTQELLEALSSADSAIDDARTGGSGNDDTDDQQAGFKEEIQAIRERVAELDALRGAERISDQAYEEEKAAHHRRLIGIYETHQAAMSRAERTALLGLANSIAPEDESGSAGAGGDASGFAGARTVAQEKSYIQEQVDLIATELDRLEAHRDAGLLSAEEYEAEVAGHYRRLEGLYEEHAQNMTSAEQTALLNLQTSIAAEAEPKTFIPGSYVPEAVEPEGSIDLGGGTSLEVMPSLNPGGKTAERNIALMKEQQALQEQAWAATEKEAQALRNANEHRDRMVSSLNAATAASGTYVSVKDRALGATVELTEAQIALGQASEEDLKKALNEQLEAIERLLPTVEEGSERYYELADAARAAQSDLEGLTDAQSRADKLTSIIGDVAQVATQVSKLTGLSEELGFSVENVIAHGATLATSIATGDVFGIVKSGIGLVAELGQTISDWFTGDSRLARAIREGTYDSVYQGLTQGVVAAMNGEGTILENLEQGFRNAVLNAVIGAMVESALVEGAVGDLVKKMSRAFAAGDYDAAAGFAEQINAALPGLAESMAGILEPFEDFKVTPDVQDPDVQDPDGDIESTINSTVDFGGVPPAVQFTVATPLVEAAELMYQAAQMMLTGSQVNVSAASPDTALATQGDLGRFTQTIGRAEAMYGRVEAMYGRLLEEGVLIKSEQTVRLDAPRETSATAHLR